MPPARAPISSLVDERTEGLMEGGRGAGTNLALQHPAPAPAPAQEGGATATMDPPAGFVRAWTPAVTAPLEGAHFRAAHRPGRFGSRCPGRAKSRPRPLRGRPAPIASRNARRLHRVLEDAGQREFRGVPARAR